MPDLRDRESSVLYATISDVLHRRGIVRRINPAAGSVYFFRGERAAVPL